MNKKIPTTIAISIVLIAVILTGGFVYWRYFSFQEELFSKQTTFIPKNITQDETANWQTYKNEFFKFSIKYPPDFNITKDELPKESVYSVANEFLEISNKSILESPRLILFVNPEGFGAIPPDIIYKVVLNKENEIEITKREEIPQSEDNQNIDDQVIIAIGLPAIKLGVNNYSMEFLFKEGGKDYEATFKKMLSTFKFLD